MLVFLIPHEVYLALARGAKPPRLDHPPIRVFWFTGRVFTEGMETHEVDGVPLRVYSPEKTLGDCFKYRKGSCACRRSSQMGHTALGACWEPSDDRGRSLPALDQACPLWYLKGLRPSLSPSCMREDINTIPGQVCQFVDRTLIQ